MTIDEAISHEERNVEINKLIGEVTDCEQTDAIAYHRQLVEWLKELKQLREQTRWIPVSERSPEEPGDYWITWTGILGEHGTKRTKPLMSIAEYEIYEPENYADWITTMYDFEYYHDIKVLAWMPLPEPYRAESEDKE